MSHNEPVDVLAIASQRMSYASELVRGAMLMNYSAANRQWFDQAWAEYRIASDDLDAVQDLIRELAKAE